MDDLRTRRALLATGISALAAATTSTARAASRTAEASPITIPVRLAYARLLVDLWLDGKGPLPFTLDTGASAYAIGLQFARTLGLKTTLSAQMEGVSGGAHRVDDFLIGQVVIGGALKSEKVVFTSARIADDLSVGLAPFQLLMLRPTLIDPAAGEVRIFETGAPDLTGFERLSLVKQRPWIEGITVEDGQERNPQMVIDVKLDGVPFRVGVDTGNSAGGLTLFGRTVDRRGLWDRFPKWAPTNGRGVYEGFRARMIRGGKLEVGSTVMAGPTVELIDPKEKSPINADGLIGMDALRRLSLFVDYGRSALWIRPNGALDQPFRYDRSGIQAGFAGGRMVVRSLVPGSPAVKAGIEPGDAILPTGKANPRRFLWNLSDAPGTVIAFSVQRGGETKPVRLVLEELI